MNSHICVILVLCLTEVFCTSSRIENLDANELYRILTGETTINEWETATNQSVIYEHPDGRRTTVNVWSNLLDFQRRAEEGKETYFERIHNIIKLSYQCTIKKYANISNWFIFQDLSQLTVNIHEAIRVTQETLANDPLWKFDPQTIFANELFKKKIFDLNYGKFYLDFDFKLNGNFQLIFPHVLDFQIKKDIHRFWADMIEKALGIKIRYKIYTDVMRAKFKNKYDLPFVDTINELMCVLNEAIKIIDSFIVTKCVQHSGNFVYNFQSLENGVNGNFVSVLKQFDQINNRRSSRLELYKDYTKSIPGTSPEIAAINASGCFVEYLEFAVSGIETYLANNMDPTNIYGHNFVERTSQINMKLMESTGNQPQGEIKIGMISFQAERDLFDDHHQPSDLHVVQHGETGI